MPDRGFLKESEVPRNLDIGQYVILVKKNGKFHKAFLFENASGHLMMDMVPDYRAKYPTEQGYTIEW